VYFVQVALQRAAQEKQFKLSKDLAKLKKQARKTIRGAASINRLFSRGSHSG